MVLSIMLNDKKIKNGKFNFILLEKLGSAIINDNVDQKSIINVLEEL